MLFNLITKQLITMLLCKDNGNNFESMNPVLILGLFYWHLTASYS